MSHLQSFLKNPIGFVSRAVYKATIGRLKYASKNDYDAERFWGDRFRKYGLSLVGPGHDGFSLKENEEAYREAAGVFVNLCLQKGIDFKNVSILEIGCGTGYYAELFKSKGVRSYLGVDVTDALFQDLKRRFEKYQFSKIDIGANLLPRGKKFGLITLIDVAQHIVSKAKFNFALDNIDKSLSAKGRFVFTADLERNSSVHAFYETQWVLSDFSGFLRGYKFGAPQQFRDKYIICATKP